MLAFFHFHLMTRSCLSDGENSVLRLHEFELLFFMKIEVSFGRAGDKRIPTLCLSRWLKRTNVVLFLRDTKSKSGKLFAELFPLVYGNPFKRFLRNNVALLRLVSLARCLNFVTAFATHLVRFPLDCASYFLIAI